MANEPQALTELDAIVRDLRSGAPDFTTLASRLENAAGALRFGLAELVKSHQRSQELVDKNTELVKTVASLRKQLGRLEHLKAAVLSSIQDGEANGLGNALSATPQPTISSAVGETPAETPVQSPSEPVDRKVFFRVVKSRLAPEDFSQFLGCIKRLNNKEQTREDTLNEARTLLAPLNNDLYLEFVALMNQRSDASVAGSETLTERTMSTTSEPVDGKAFFKTAKSRMAPEAFSQFLASLKRYNSQQQTREATLEEARTLFGPDNQSLCVDFENLLSRQGM